MHDILLRLAEPGDAAALQAIYAPYTALPVTFEEAPPDVAEFERRILTISRMYPYVVAQRGDELIGYGYVHRYHERASYRWCGETSLYLRQDAVGQGLGSRIYGTVIGLARLQGLRSLYAAIVLPNPASQRMQLSHGFDLIGIFKGAGYKCGTWLDVAYYGLRLDAPPGPPEEPRPLPDVDPRQVEAVLRR